MPPDRFDAGLVAAYVVLHAMLGAALSMSAVSNVSVEQVGANTLYSASDFVRLLTIGVAVVHAVLLPVAVRRQRRLMAGLIVFMLVIFSLFSLDNELSYLEVRPDGFTRVRRPLFTEQCADVKFEDVAAIDLGMESRDDTGERRRSLFVRFKDGTSKEVRVVPSPAADQIQKLFQEQGPGAR